MLDLEQTLNQNSNLRIKATHVYPLQLPVNSKLPICVQNTMDKLFSKEETLLYIHEGDLDPYPPTEVNPHVAINFNNKRVARSNYQHFKHNYVIHVERFNLTKDLLSHIITSKVWHLLLSHYGTFLLITTEKKLNTIFTTFWRHGIVNLIVLVYGSQGDAMIFTADPQAVENQCGLKLNKFLTKTDCTSLEPIKLPQIWRKFSNCQMVYVNGMAKFRRGMKAVEAAWFVLDTFRLLFNVTNITVNYRETDNIIFDPFTFKSQFHRNRDNMTTGIYYTEDFVWIVPLPKQIPAMETLRLIFKNDVWLWIGITFAAISVTWWLIYKYLQLSPEFNAILLRVLSITLFGSVHKYELSWVLRILFMVYVLYSIHVQTAFNSKLTEVLTMPQYEPKIKDVRELASSNTIVLIRKDNYEIYFGHEESKNDLYNNIKLRLKVLDGDSMSKIVFDKETYKQYGLLVEKSYTELVARLKWFSPAIIEDNTFLGKLGNVFVGMQNAYVLKTIDKVISRLTESGILDYYIKNVKYQLDPTKMFLNIKIP
ncbi:hypothetical protein FQR65_LT01981 [Abscondita terminalis]|nr:hypothetical protein FQR65_LT01981 [Abscondita terminalis]